MWQIIPEKKKIKWFSKNDQNEPVINAQKSKDFRFCTELIHVNMQLNPNIYFSYFGELNLLLFCSQNLGGKSCLLN